MSSIRLKLIKMVLNVVAAAAHDDDDDDDIKCKMKIRQQKAEWQI